MSRPLQFGEGDVRPSTDPLGHSVPALDDTRRGMETGTEPTQPKTKWVEEFKRVNSSEPSGVSESTPKRFGQYEVIKELGRGGMATVYLALDTRLERKVALKVPHKTVAADPEYMARFLREARSAATLSHPNICTIFEASEIGGTPYMTMAYIEGKTLTDLIAVEHPIPLKRIAITIRKIAQAMEFAHRAGIIHRDLKPSNIMIDGRKEPIIMDFGLARRSEEDSRLTQDGLLIGTPIYMAPEVAKKGAGVSGTSSDIYSLGAILYELLAGRPPYKGTVQAVLVQVMRGIPKPPSEYRSDLDAGLENICLRAMAKDPADRYATMGEFAVALRDYLQNPDSSVMNAVEVVEETPVQAEEAPAARTPTERRPASERASTAARSGPRIRRQTPDKHDSDSVKLVVSLVGVSILTMAAIIGAIVAFKKDRSSDPAAPVHGSTAPADVATSPPTPVPTPSPAPEPPNVAQYPLVGAKLPVKMGTDDVRIATNFRGLLPIELEEINAAGGRFRFLATQLVVDDDPKHATENKEGWSPQDSDGSSERITPIYQISHQWLGDLIEGRVINVKLTAIIVFPSNGFSSNKRTIRLHVVPPEVDAPAAQ